MSKKNFVSYGDMETLVTQIVSKISGKVDKVSGKGLSTNDYTTADKNKVDALKSASTKDVPKSGDASSSQVVMGNDSRLTDSRNAKDVYSWAKAATKPTYTASDVGLSNVPNVSTNNQTPTFSQASTRNNIASGEKLSVIFGKIQKFFNDLKTVAFTGSYSDLTDKPSEYPATQVMMSDGVTSVEEAIDELTADRIGTAVDVSSYTSSNKYTCPSDGYLFLKVTGTNSWLVYAIGLEEIEVGVAEVTGGYNAFYVRKGLQIWKLRQSSAGTHGAKFYPLQ